MTVVAVRFAGRFDRFPTREEVLAGTLDTTPPFRFVGPPLLFGQKWYVGAIGIDQNNVETGLATITVTLTLSTPWLYTRSRTNYFQDAAKTIVATTNDPVYTWAGAGGTTRDLVHRYPSIPGFRPLVQKDGAAVRFGDPAMSTGGMFPTTKRGAFVFPEQATIATWTEAELILVLQRAAAPISDGDGGALFQFGAQGNGEDLFPRASDGHWISRFGTTKTYDLGELAAAVINGTDGPHVIRLCSSPTRWAAYLDGALLHEDLAPSPAFDQVAPTLGENVLGGHFNGVVYTAVLFDAVNAEADGAVWAQGALDDATATQQEGTVGDSSESLPLEAKGDDGDVQYNNAGVIAGKPFRDFGRWESLIDGDPDTPQLIVGIRPSGRSDIIVGFRPPST